jgi:hypothetical protein
MTTRVDGTSTKTSPIDIAGACYLYADMMIKRRELH